ncbi:hypothetical protein ACOSP7_014986 [Xanthoceras sorbifolium]|uniref:Uncharacterized protein n=1 Tax=Xanthoceras sorbifolium TaxID=99658 RepID=A0ABQ8I6E6_9ROSI|nr:hypothetical protein JRO89_XS04G0184700 [Xanthoceras sorbifolium]
MAPPIPKQRNRRLSTAANLANLLPTGTALAFQALMPYFTNNGSCLVAHKYLTSSAIICFSFICFIFSFTDSFIAASNGKLYYGIATCKGLYIFNKDDYDDDKDNDNDTTKREKGNQAQQHNEGDEEIGEVLNDQKTLKISTKDGLDDDAKEILAKYRIRLIDFVHAFCSWLVFMVCATSSSDVQRCFFSDPSDNGKALMMNLPLAVGAAVSFLFMLFPTRRRGIGYVDTTANEA